MPFRQYDPAIARFTSIDPVIHHNMSPYNGFDNNPIFFADPSGANSTDFVMRLFNRSGNDETWTNNNDGTFSSDRGKTEECEECPQVQIFTSDPDQLKGILRLGFLDISNDDIQREMFMGFYPYHTISDEEKRAELMSLLINIATAGLGNSSRFAKLADLADSASSGYSALNLELLPMNNLIREEAAWDKLIEFEKALMELPYSMANYATKNNMVLIFSETNLFEGKDYNETPNITNLEDYYSGIQNANYMYSGVHTGDGFITIIHALKIKK